MLYTKLKKVSDGLLKVSMGFLIVLGFVMLIMTVVHIFFRYVLGNSLTWSDEFLRTSLVWFGMVAMSTISANLSHVSITIFLNKFPKKAQHAIRIFVQFVITIAVVTVFMLGIKLVLSAGGRLTTAMRIPYRFTYSAVPLGFLLVSVYEIRNLTAVLCDIKQEKPKDEPLIKAEDFERL